HRRGQEIAFGRLDTLGQSLVTAKPRRQLDDRVGEPLAHWMIGLPDDLPKPGVERGQEALAVDKSEQARHADPEARGETHPLAIAREELVDDVPGGRTKRGPGERLRERAPRGRHEPPTPL